LDHPEKQSFKLGKLDDHTVKTREKLVDNSLGYFSISNASRCYVMPSIKCDSARL
jgi:hypothetical protein